MRIRLLFCLLAINITYFAANKEGDIFGTRNFIKNLGQFDDYKISKEPIKYGLDNGDEQIYFTEKGLVYVLIKHNEIDHEEYAEQGKTWEEDYLDKPKEVFIVQSNWLNCNSNIQIEESERQAHYFTYGGNSMHAPCFKKITFKNVYDNIDFEYFIPADKNYGIKYNIILHPGADPSKIRINYSGALNEVFLNGAGDVVVTTNHESVVEHAPVSFQNGKEVKTSYKVSGTTIQFNIQGEYNSNEELVIDPWVTTITSLSSNMYGYDVDLDNFGNLFVYGGYNNFKLAKYDQAGTLLWTFPGSVTTPAWTSGSLAGNFVVKRITGQCFVAQGINGGGTRIIRLDAATGNYDNLISTPVSNWLECWDMAYHCTTGNVYGFGGSVPSNLCSGVLDQVTGTITPLNFINYSTHGHDVVSHTIDNNGEVYLLFASVQTPQLNNQIVKVNSAFTSSVWIAPSNFMTMQEASNKIYIGGNNGSNGYNALASNANYLYYYDGYNIAAYNKNNGTMLGSISISSLTAKQQGGIAVDDCDNVYVGGKDGTLLSYKFTGSSFVALPSVNLNITTANKYVCDIRYDKPSNLLYVSGSGFVGTFPAVNSATCPLVADCNYSNPNTYTIVCYGSSVTVTMSNLNNLTNPTYSIQPGGQSQSSPTFTVNPSVTTDYTLFVTGLNSSNAVVTNTAIASVTVMPAPAVSPSLTNGTCANPVTSSVNLNVSFNPSGSPNYTVNWSPLPGTVTPVNSATASGLVPGMNMVTITTSNGCTTTASFSVPPIPLPATFVIVNPSNDYTITCSNPNVLLTTSVTNGVPLTYTWFPSCSPTLTGASYNFTSACNGQVVGSSSTGCLHTETFTIYQDMTSPTIAVTPTAINITCTVSPITFTGTSSLGPNVTTNWFQVVGTNTMYVGAAGGTLNIFQPGSPGVYWFESVYNITGCKSTKSVQVTADVGVPVFTLTSSTNFTIGCSTTSITSMQVSSVVTSPTLNVPVNYAFVAPPATATPVFTTNPNQNNITQPGTWVVYVKDITNDCISSQSISIIQNTIAPNVNFIQPLSILSCKDPSMVLQGISSNTNASIQWTVPAVPSSSVNPTPNTTVTINPAVNGATNNITSVGIFTVGAQDNNNKCTSTKTVQIMQDIRIPRFTISALTNSVINCINPDVVIVPIITPSLAGALVPSFVWYPPVGSSVPGSQFNTTSAGSHTAIGTSAVNGCTYEATYNVAIDMTPPAVVPSDAFIVDCNVNPTVVITPSITGSTTGFTYSWTVPSGALTSNLTNSAITSNMPGEYFVVMTNTINGCITQAYYSVVNGSITADFTPNPAKGYAPLDVTFTNNSSTSTGASSIISTWGYGDGVATNTILNATVMEHVYNAAGTYTVYLKVQKGSCVDTALRVVIVDLPSKLEIPNVFTPNGDKSNDIFRLRASNLKEIYIIIFDRWGNKVYETTSETGNFAWDGKNLQGKDCADGTYFYIIKATGADDTEFEKTGNVSLYR